MEATVSASLFTWSDGAGVAEISCLGGLRPEHGVTVVSPRTGRTRRFVLQEVVRGDGSVTCWRLRCPAFPLFTLTIFND